MVCTTTYHRRGPPQTIRLALVTKIIERLFRVLERVTFESEKNYGKNPEYGPGQAEVNPLARPGLHTGFFPLFANYEPTG